MKITFLQGPPQLSCVSCCFFLLSLREARVSTNPVFFASTLAKIISDYWNVSLTYHSTLI